MKAILCEELGPPDRLVVRDVDEPRPAPGEIVVEPRAIALNFFDTLIIEGRYQTKPDLPFSPGGEIAGLVREVGSGVKGFAPGDRVIAYPGYGGARELVVVQAECVFALPEGVPFEAAAGLLIAYGTAYHALAHRARLRAGETLVVLGASGGTGTAAIEIGQLLGARVIAAASSEAKLAHCRKKGADAGIDYSREDLKTRIRELTGGRGADVVYDPVGGDLAEAALRACAWKGRHLVIGFAAGDIPKIPLNLLLLKGCDLVGVFWGRFTKEEPEAFRACADQLVAWLAEGRLSVPAEHRYPLAEAADAIAAIKGRKVSGKVVLVP